MNIMGRRRLVPVALRSRTLSANVGEVPHAQPNPAGIGRRLSWTAFDSLKRFSFNSVTFIEIAVIPEETTSALAPSCVL